MCLFICQDFLQNFWPQLQAAHELYSSISQSLQEKESEGSQREFAEYLPAEVLEAGIKSGRYIMVQYNTGPPTWFMFSESFLRTMSNFVVPPSTMTIKTILTTVMTLDKK